MELGLTGKVALVTGASKGIGQATAIASARTSPAKILDIEARNSQLSYKTVLGWLDQYLKQEESQAS
jgi:NAD(P)-dependent dehydrogenase (short-subunit alcohol dehydrogenase family)